MSVMTHWVKKKRFHVILQCDQKAKSTLCIDCNMFCFSALSSVLVMETSTHSTKGILLIFRIVTVFGV